MANDGRCATSEESEWVMNKLFHSPFLPQTATSQPPLHVVVSLAAQLPATEKDIGLKERVNQSLHILRNLCMDGGLHEALVESKNEVLIVTLLMPLCGGEELTEEENDKLPIDLQYLEATKRRTKDVYTKRTLLEALYQVRMHLLLL